MEIQITEINGVVRDERKNERKKQLSHRHVWIDVSDMDWRKEMKMDTNRQSVLLLELDADNHDNDECLNTWDPMCSKN